MKAIIVDSNIIFAALRSKNSLIRQKLENTSYHFYAPKFLFVEIFKHKERILKSSNDTEESLLEYLATVLHYINFINEDVIPTHVYISAFSLCRNVDENDVIFVALAIALGGEIWTRDLQLRKGLLNKGFDGFIDENDL